MDSNCGKKRYMKFAESSGCIRADYNSIRDSENSILVINNNVESGVFCNEKTTLNYVSELQDRIEPYY